MKFKRISTKMSAAILPIIILALVVLAAISIRTSKKIINDQTKEKMTFDLMAQDGAMGHYLSSVANMAATIANSVESTHSLTGISMYEKMLTNIIPENDIVIGSGLWFEPYVIYPTTKYLGPYVYKKDGAIFTTYLYSDEEYNYFEQEYYKLAKASTKPVFTDPYYDPISDTFMATCSAPIILKDKFLGCVTVDIRLDTIVDLINNIKVGEEGYAILTTSSGNYISGTNLEVIKSGLNIANDPNPSLAKAGAEISSKNDGTTSFEVNGRSYNLYYSSLNHTGWKLILAMPVDELNAPIKGLTMTLLIISALAILASIAAVLLQVRSISKRINNVKRLSAALADGDFTVEPITVVAPDEIGQMNELLNQMYASNKEDIDKIKRNARRVYDSSVLLKDSSDTLSREFNEILSFLEEVNAEIESTSAATEEVNASTEEVLANVNVLAEHTNESMLVASEIKERAAAISKNSKASYDSATALSVKFEKNLQTSIENAKVVESIGELAEAISKIAGKINLLSLNASIEAARAGEAGKGFAVVATEIGALAASTAETVEKIQVTITAVKDSFHGLTEDAKGLLGFVQDTVAPDYNKFVDVAKQYGRDAESIDETAHILSEMASTIRKIMSETTVAIQSIAEAAQTTTTLSSNIMASVSSVSDNVQNVSDMSDKQDKVVRSLTSIVDKFKLEEDTNSEA